MDLKKDLKDSQDQQHNTFQQEKEEKPYYLTKEEKEAMLKEVKDSLAFMEEHWDEIE